VTQLSPIVHARGTAMLRSALGPAIAAWLDDANVAEIMLNADGRLWVDYLDSGIAETGERLSPLQADRIIRLVAHHVGAEVAHAFRLSCPKAASASKACCRRWWGSRSFRSGGPPAFRWRSPTMSRPAR
jgi:hypothetical protein